MNQEILIVSPAESMRDAPRHGSASRDQVEGPHDKTVGIQFESCRGHLKPANCGGLFLYSNPIHEAFCINPEQRDTENE